LTLTALSILVLIFFVLLFGVVVLPAFFGSPWHPLLPGTIREILDFADIQPGEKIYDLGSGDGRVLIQAAHRYGAIGVGLEIDPLKVWVARKLARLWGVDDRVKILRKNFNDFDFRDADVIYVYLTHQALDRLIPKILPYLKPSTRIVSYRFCLRSRQPSKTNSRQNLFMYRLDKGTKVDGYS
jgi:cyclopropane fatty-acyl-phospholipid synthase-like methyltransferase